MERFHIEIELDDDDARRIQANDMMMGQFAKAHVGDN
jgi:hypothetical protein